MPLEILRQRLAALGGQTELFGAIAQQRLQLRIALQPLGHARHRLTHLPACAMVATAAERLSLAVAALPIGNEAVCPLLASDTHVPLGLHLPDGIAAMSGGRFMDEPAILAKGSAQIL
ncbi:hypothetical protein, partial [Sphingobium yanoikuyae]|uniref:hypothetical protein n=1 Tax=Sphingobium yanoikuyae TaxID=13690 RepID=UPI002449DAFF